MMLGLEILFHLLKPWMSFTGSLCVKMLKRCGKF